ncbi:hypothetical protein DICPUDRAFT_37528 [Dictyostelium purpureum]|uniref:Calcineurin-like phosphoesterase domain-containing protein n=1 Tax=Dictyostelium purpureum TaxID=5786 RepID=F0ZSY8_DICPU|nr:uncharacterized protein DICPUDRAFT_37528 [Dictyostelium purpureum]EGC32924.1 hypothetical protein DICPUDRAFT_37528 [Dictyostelium purpureum]|eukprot:XP_003290532.1 hypothetical protein DICPUDRAFT_37528 [Dictyostelium purpureum]
MGFFLLVVNCSNNIISNNNNNKKIKNTHHNSKIIYDNKNNVNFKFNKISNNINKNKQQYSGNHNLININKNNKEDYDYLNYKYDVSNSDISENNLDNLYDNLDLESEDYIQIKDKQNSNNLNYNNNNKKSNLKFNKNNKFKIIQFTDLHYGEGENLSWGPEQDINSSRVMNTILDKEKQVDLVIFTGDLITGNNIIDNATLYWEKAIGVVKQRNIPWAIAFGNHDDLASGTNGSREDLMAFDISLGSYSQFGPSQIPGVSNYYLQIFDKDDKYPISMVWVLDSGDVDNRCGHSSRLLREQSRGPSDYQCNTYITKEQVQWYSNTTKYLKQSSLFDHILWSGAFFHIPLQEYMLLWNYDTCHGYNNDSIACQPKNEGLLEEFVNNGDISFISVGHNHGNDFCGTLDSVKMCYGRHSGYGGYGTWERGARVIELSLSSQSETPKVHFNTWITFETGQQVFNQLQHRPNSTGIPQTKCT